MTLTILLIIGLIFVSGMIGAIALQYEYRELTPLYLTGFGAAIFAMFMIFSGVFMQNIIATIIGFLALIAITILAPRLVKWQIERHEIEIFPFELNGYVRYLTSRKMDVLFCAALMIPVSVGAFILG